MKKSIFLLILLMPLWIMAQSQSAHKRAVRHWQNNIPYTPDYQVQPRTSILVYTFIFPTLPQGHDQAEVACRTSDLPNIIGQAKLIHEKGLHIDNAHDFIRKIGLSYTRPVGL